MIHIFRHLKLSPTDICQNVYHHISLFDHKETRAKLSAELATPCKYWQVLTFEVPWLEQLFGQYRGNVTSGSWFRNLSVLLISLTRAALEAVCPNLISREYLLLLTLSIFCRPFLLSNIPEAFILSLTQQKTSPLLTLSSISAVPTKSLFLKLLPSS